MPSVTFGILKYNVQVTIVARWRPTATAGNFTGLEMIRP